MLVMISGDTLFFSTIRRWPVSVAPMDLVPTFPLQVIPSFDRPVCMCQVPSIHEVLNTPVLKSKRHWRFQTSRFPGSSSIFSNTPSSRYRTYHLPIDITTLPSSLETSPHPPHSTMKRTSPKPAAGPSTELAARTLLSPGEVLRSAAATMHGRFSSVEADISQLADSLGADRNGELRDVEARLNVRRQLLKQYIDAIGNRRHGWEDAAAITTTATTATATPLTTSFSSYSTPLGRRKHHQLQHPSLQLQLAPSPQPLLATAPTC